MFIESPDREFYALVSQYFCLKFGKASIWLSKSIKNHSVYKDQASWLTSDLRDEEHTANEIISTAFTTIDNIRQSNGLAAKRLGEDLKFFMDQFQPKMSRIEKGLKTSLQSPQSLSVVKRSARTYYTKAWQPLTHAQPPSSLVQSADFMWGRWRRPEAKGTWLGLMRSFSLCFGWREPSEGVWRRLNDGFQRRDIECLMCVGHSDLASMAYGSVGIVSCSP